MCAACCQSSYGDNSSGHAYLGVYCAVPGCPCGRTPPVATMAEEDRARRRDARHRVHALLVRLQRADPDTDGGPRGPHLRPGRGHPHPLPRMGYVGQPDRARPRFRRVCRHLAVHGTRLAAAGHRVYALDLDGWGYSQRVAPFTAEHQATRLLALIAALHLQRPVRVGLAAVQRSSPWPRCADRRQWAR